MSFITKITSLFSSNSASRGAQTPGDPALDEIVKNITKPPNKFNLKNTSQSLMLYLLDREENNDTLFRFIANPEELLLQIKPLPLIYLLSCVHRVFHSQELTFDVAYKLKETKLDWLHQTEENQEKESLKLAISHRRAETEVQITKSNSPEDLFSFLKIYHIFLQRLAANVDLVRSVQMNSYPYISQQDFLEPKLMLLWQFKIQNILNTALSLLQLKDPDVLETQILIYKDLYQLHQFLCAEVTKITEFYATLPNQDTLSLHEIYNDSTRHTRLLNEFVARCKPIIELKEISGVTISSNNLQDFLTFASKVKMLNQMNFKKSIKVPSKNHPNLNQENTSTEKQHFNKSGIFKPNTYMDNNIEMSFGNTPKQRAHTHIRGLSTFYQ